MRRLYEKHRTVIAGARNRLAGRMIRIGTMGAIGEGDILADLLHLEDVLAELGMPMKRVIDFEGEDEKDSLLNREGILRKYDFIAGLAVHHEEKFWGAALRCRQNINAVEFLKDLCEEVAIETREKIS